MYDPSKDYVRQQDLERRREAQERLDQSDRPWEQRNNRLLNRFGGGAGRKLALLFVLVTAVVLLLVFLTMNITAPPA